MRLELHFVTIEMAVQLRNGCFDEIALSALAYWQLTNCVCKIIF